MVKLADNHPVLHRRARSLGSRAWTLIRRGHNTKLLALLLLLLILTYSLSLPSVREGSTAFLSSQSSQVHKQERPNWPGWDGIEYMVAFGDSVSTTKFKPEDAAPSRENPMGNPEWPGKTSANGWNYLNYMTAMYNGTFTRTINLSQGGATINGDLIKQSFAGVRDLGRQLKELWEKFYVPAPDSFPWRSNSTLFSIFLGTNDCMLGWRQRIESRLGENVSRYGELLHQLYATGARNFLIWSAFPINRGPQSISVGKDLEREMGIVIEHWNADVSAMLSNFTATHADVTLHHFDTWTLFNTIMDEPCAYEETCGFEDTHWWCKAYRDGTEKWDSKAEECDLSVDKYFWLGQVHPTWPVHKVMARLAVEQLREIT